VKGEPKDLARQARSIAEDVRVVCPGGGVGSLSTAIELLAAAILATYDGAETVAKEERDDR
jgi:hypothetical protein